MYVRVRPASAEERAAKSRNVVSVTAGHPDREVVVKEKGTDRKFFYDRVFDDISKQKDVFQCVAQPLIKQVGLQTLVESMQVSPNSVVSCAELHLAIY